jgi:hypothetical protein
MTRAQSHGAQKWRNTPIIVPRASIRSCTLKRGDRLQDARSRCSQQPLTQTACTNVAVESVALCVLTFTKLSSSDLTLHIYRLGFCIPLLGGALQPCPPLFPQEERNQAQGKDSTGGAMPPGFRSRLCSLSVMVRAQALSWA